MSISSSRLNHIDAMRFFAFVAIFLFHTHLSTFETLFVGVDIFFVISGYVIGLSVSKRKSERDDWPVKFILDRARRLLPPLLITIFISSVAGLFILRPAFLVDLGQSMVFASLQVSNLWFWYEIDYFDRDALTKPLLHTWSLSVEEQIYFLLFVYAVTVRKVLSPRTWLTLMVVSFIFAQMVFYFDEQTYFYGSFSRIAQFMAGWMLSRADISMKIKLFYGVLIICVGTILGNIFFAWSGIAVLGIVSLSTLQSTRLISFFAKFGRPTYSLYLVHYPVSVYLAEMGLRIFPVMYLTTYFLLTFFLGYLLYILVEKRSA